MTLADLARTVRTLRHLRPAQIAWRLRYRWRRRRPAVVPDVPENTPLRGDFPQLPPVCHRPGPAGGPLLERLQQGVFEHLGTARSLGRDPPDWQLGRQADGRLWTATLHYHAWAWELAELVLQSGPSAATADELLRHYLTDWIARCGLSAPDGRQFAWNAYATATRIGWWCRLYHRLAAAGRRDWGPLEPAFLRSLWTQAAYLHRHLEYDLQGNHLLRDAVGLAAAGRFFTGPQPRRWLQTAARLAVDQARQQVLPDGGHFERSPMYHLHVMEDLLSLVLLLEDETARSQLTETWQRMARFLAWIRHPDGRIPLLNDAALNGACDPQVMLHAGGEALGKALSTTPNLGGKLFADFGLLVWHGRPWSVFFDVGPVGPDCQPGHAHADTLSLQASYLGHRLFVDPGVIGYDHDDARGYDRATASHNTLCIDETDSSEVWHIFRVGRRARPIDVVTDIGVDRCRASAAHRGYDHLPGRPRHHRELEVANNGRLTIVDRIEGSGTHSIEGGVLIDPIWQVEENQEGWDITHEDCHVSVILQSPRMTRSTEQRPYHPEFGRQGLARRLVWRGVLQLPCEIVFRARAVAR